MKVDLSNLFLEPGVQLEFSGVLDLSGTKRFGRKLFAGPVQVRGRAENRAGIVSVAYQADCTLDLVCDRCLTPLTSSRQLQFTHTVVLSLNREDDDEEYIVIPDGQLDLAELANADILLAIPTSIVCGESCKGLCPVCGQNLNERDCGCDRSFPDRRLDKLRELLK